MRFPTRELKPYSEPVKADDLEPGKTLFSVTFADPDMFIPELEAIVFLGFDLEVGDEGMAYFQDLYSHSGEAQPSSESSDVRGALYVGHKNELQHIFDYEHALDVLLVCALRRKAKGVI